ncbi:MAG: hypothetical protein QM504_15810, partial [Pseudomonadota bacterium]
MSASNSMLDLLIITNNSSFYSVCTKSTIFVFITWLIIELIFGYLNSAREKTNDIYDYWRVDMYGNVAKKTGMIVLYWIYSTTVAIVYLKVFLLFSRVDSSITVIDSDSSIFITVFSLILFLIVSINKFLTRKGEYNA